MQCCGREATGQAMLQAVMHNMPEDPQCVGRKNHGPECGALQEPAVQQRAAGLHHDHCTVLRRLLLGGEYALCHAMSRWLATRAASSSCALGASKTSTVVRMN